MQEYPANWPADGGADRRISRLGFGGAANVRRWNGVDRTTADWNGLRKDPELWLASGDCFVHIHAKGHANPGPSFCIDSAVLRQCRAAHLLDSLAQPDSRPDERADCPPDESCDSLGDEWLAYLPDDSPDSASPRSIFIPAPPAASDDEALEWHLTTRNFFAFCHTLPIVGITLGQAVISLRKRLEVWRPGDEDNTEDIVTYLDSVGYLSFPHCPDYALAALQFAEHAQLEGLWTDAFAHAVGMSKMLPTSVDLAKVSASTAKLINKTASELNAHVRTLTSALGTFLEDGLSPARLGLTASVRSYLGVFRGFLRQFYARKFGFWPPPENSLFSKSLFRSMCSDFQLLYDYLVDTDSTNSLQNQRLASGGFCVFQNIHAFNTRLGLVPLPHPLPKLPESTPNRRFSQSPRAFARLKISPKLDGTEGKASLESAANSWGSTSHLPIIKAFRQFESDNAPANGKSSISDARKISWIVVYFMLQHLKSLVDPPYNVSRADEATYPICSQVIAKVAAPWVDMSSYRRFTEDLLRSTLSESSVDSGSKSRSTASSLMITPDCQSDNYIKHMEVSTTSWRQTLAIKEPSAAAFKELERLHGAPKKTQRRGGIAQLGPYLRKRASIIGTKSIASSSDSRPQTRNFSSSGLGINVARISGSQRASTIVDDDYDDFVARLVNPRPGTGATIRPLPEEENDKKVDRRFTMMSQSS